MNIQQIETPALLVDVKEVEYNISRMNDILKNSTAKLRPHFKTTKSLYFVKKQLSHGVKGITCAKLSEAEVLVEAGVKDILIANQVVQDSKVSRLAYMAKKSRITVCVDNEANVRQLAMAAKQAGSTIYIYIEYEMGMHRCGVETMDEFYGLVLEINKYDSLKFDGIQAYMGFIAHEEDIQKRYDLISQGEDRLKELKSYLEDRKITVNQISGCSSGTVEKKAKDGIYTELQCGSYIFSDTSYRACKIPFHEALFILATVVSKKQGMLVLDAGIKGMGVDQKPPDIPGYPDCKLTFSEEHLAVTGADFDEEIGDKLLIIPGHCCTTINLYDYLYLKDGNEILEQIPIEGRGKSI